MYKPMPSYRHLHRLFEVAPIEDFALGVKSGLVWRSDRKRGIKAGSNAGFKKFRRGSLTIFDWRVRVDGSLFTVSRIIYFMSHKIDPGCFQVDHVDRNPSNNNIANLRLDLYGDFHFINRSVQLNNTSGATGVYWSSEVRKWRAAFKLDGKHHHLGYFACKLDAAVAVNKVIVGLEWDLKGRSLIDLNDLKCSCALCEASEDDRKILG